MASSLILLSCLLFGQPQSRMTASEVEDALIFSGSEPSFEYVNELAAHPKEYLPILAKLLVKYAKKPPEGSAFPGNALRAIALMPTPAAGEQLKKYRATDEFAAWNLRRKYKDSTLRILDRSYSLFTLASYESKVVKELPKGTVVKVVKARIVNGKLEGPRGGSSIYDRVQVRGSRLQGYLERPGFGSLTCGF